MIVFIYKTKIYGHIYAYYTWMDGQMNTKINRTHLDLCSKVIINLQMDRCNMYLVIVHISIDIEYTDI